MTMFIDDEELRSLYEAASAEHITAIETGLLQLEKNPTDRSPLKMLLREAHSLKGDSRMLGVIAAEQVMHQMEEVMMDLDQGALAVTPELCDQLYQGLDAIDKIAKEATTGQPAGVDLEMVIAAVRGTKYSANEAQESIGLFTIPSVASEVYGDLDFSATPPTMTEAWEANSNQDFSGMLADMDFGDSLATVTNPTEESSAAGAMPDLAFLADFNRKFENPPIVAESWPEEIVAPPPPTENFEISTIKVEASRLERLTIQADELSVAKLRIAQRQDDLLALYRFWEEWSRQLPGNDPQIQQFGQLLNQMRLTSAEDNARLAAVSNELESGIRQMRMLPLQSIFSVFPRMVRDLARQQDKAIEFMVEGGEILADKQILEALKDPLTHILRNAIDHGIEPLKERGNKSPTAKLRLRGIQRGNQIEIQVIDDGRGLDLDAIRQTAMWRGLYSPAELAQMNEEQIQSLIFAPGFSTRTTVTEISGRGVGLDVVRTNIEKIKGTVRIESLPDRGCTFRILLNNSLATVDALIMRVDSLPYAMPIDNIETMLFVDRQEIFSIDGKLTVNWQQQSVSLIWLADLLELNWQAPESGAAIEQLRSQIPCVFVKIDGQFLGILVDELLEQQQIVVKTPNRLLRNIRNISGASILGNGEICMVLNLLEIFQMASGQTTRTTRPLLIADRPPSHILLVEDSIPIRTQVKRILVGAGYEVTTAVDGTDGFNQLLTGSFDGIVSDIEMPNLTGLEMTSQIRQLPEYQNLPIVLVSTLASSEHRQRGLSMGASAYLTKGDFDQSLLLQTLSQLLKS
jgi:two-component system, chemotaxis family, sensor kinase CheA